MMTHRFSITVYPGDTDFLGVVHHANYLLFAEKARIEMFAALKLDVLQMSQRDDLTLAVVDCSLSCYRPAALGDSLTVSSEVERLSGARIWTQQTVARGGDTVARVWATLACMSRTGRAMRLPARFRHKLATPS